MDHAARIADLTTRFDEAVGRFTTRIASATHEAAERKPDDGGWSAAQVGWHVALMNDALCGLVDGRIPNARQPQPGFVETPWPEIVAKVPAKMVTNERFVPPDDILHSDAVERLRASGGRFRAALQGLDCDRATHVIPSIFGSITLYQVGEWAIAHTIRHNVQAKRALGE